jgi:putative peptide zinc metalloprotease protein
VISRAALTPLMRRPLVLAAFALVALAALLSGGLVVAHAVDGAPSADTTTAAGSAGSGDDNVAAGVNTTDGRTVYAIRLKIVQVSGDTVDASNAAAAVNSGCTDCSTVAIAFEGVLVVGSPSDFEPTNLALAMNVDCSGCTAFADAYQQVVQSSTRVRITGEGRRKVAAIRRDLESLRTADLTLDEVRARVKADEQAFADVLLHDCVPIGHVTEPAPTGAPDVSDDPAAAVPSSEPTSSPSADASPSTSADPSASSSPDSSSPSESPSPTPSTSSSP